MTPRARLILLYALFCGIAIGANLGVQWMAQRLLGASFWAPLVAGTGAGLILKYVLDRNYIFTADSVPLRRDVSRFCLYAVFGLLTTAVFWTAEWLGEELLPGPGRYLGGAVGLTVGYVLKYAMDARWVFAKTAPTGNHSK